MDLAATAVVESDLEAELLEAYPSLLRRLTLVMRDHAAAEDLAQTTFARALEHRARFHGGDARAWLYTIGLRLAFNELGRKRPTVVLEPDDEPAWALAVEPDLWLALGQLDPHQRAAIVLNVLDGYTHAEIARVFGVRTGTVSSWVSRGKERLRLLLGDES